MNIKKTFSNITKIQIITGAFSLLAIVLILTIVLGLGRFNKINSEVSTLSNQLATLEVKLASTTDDLKGKITLSHEDLSIALDQEKIRTGSIAQSLRQEVGSVTNTLTTLQKLSKTDPELLAKYSKIFFLNENYAPARLAEVPTKYSYSDKKVLKLIPEVWMHMQNMIDDANKEGVMMYVFSAYRSFNEQQALKGQYSVTYGAGTANTFSADQGYSEHQLGTTVDMIAPGLGGNIDGFDGTAAYTWLLKNAYKYGFVISYPKDNKFYTFEPWHWRFVGVKLATDLHKDGKNFYDLDQRTIDEYLVNLFD